MNWIDFLIITLLLGYVVVALFMALIILMQRSKQEGLGAAFGGGFTDSVWGAQTSQVLVKATVTMAASFFVLAICLDRLYAYRSDQAREATPFQKALLTAPPAVPSVIPAQHAAPLGTNPAPAVPKP